MILNSKRELNGDKLKTKNKLNENFLNLIIRHYKIQTLSDTKFLKNNYSFI